MRKKNQGSHQLTNVDVEKWPDDVCDIVSSANLLSNPYDDQ